MVVICITGSTTTIVWIKSDWYRLFVELRDGVFETRTNKDLITFNKSKTFNKSETFISPNTAKTSYPKTSDKTKPKLRLNENDAKPKLHQRIFHWPLRPNIKTPINLPINKQLLQAKITHPIQPNHPNLKLNKNLVEKQLIIHLRA